MSYKLSQAAYYSQAKGKAQHILSVLGEMANDQTVTDDGTYLVGKCFPGKTYLAELTGYSPSTILRCRQELVRLGLISYEVRGMLVYYTIKVPKVRQIDHSQIDHSQIDQHSIVKLTTPPSQVDQHNREYNKDNKREINMQSKAKVTEVSNLKRTEPIAPPPAGEVHLNLKEIADEAREKLVSSDCTKKEAYEKTIAVKEKFLSKARALKESGELAAKSNPKAYLVGMLVSMSKEGPKTTSTATTKHDGPRTLDDIFANIRVHLKTVAYPDQASHIDSIVSVDALSERTIAKIKAKECQGWVGINDPQAWVQSCIDSEVYKQVQAAKEDDLNRTSADLVRLRRVLAEKQWYRKTMAEDGNTKCLPGLDAKIESLTTEIRKLKQKVSAANAA